MASVIVSHLILLGRLVLDGWILLTCVLCSDCSELSFVHLACLHILSDNHLFAVSSTVSFALFTCLCILSFSLPSVFSLNCF